MNGIGGDLFVIVYDAKANKLYGFENASGWAPKGLTIDFLHKQGLRDMPQTGVHSITVPGVVDGWQKLADKFGRKKLKDDLAPAIRTAQDGFPVPEWVAAYWAVEVDLLRTDDAATKSLFAGGSVRRKWEMYLRIRTWRRLWGRLPNTGEMLFIRGRFRKRFWRR